MISFRALFAALPTGLLLCPGVALAQDEEDASVLSSSSGLPILLRADTRLRYEFAKVDELDEQPNRGEALTFRVRPSVEFNPVPQISLLAEAEAILSVLPDRLNGFLAGPPRPEIADEQTIELNRLQVEFAPSDDVSVAVGRQRISIDDERFIGIVDFRQNQQTYDALTASVQPIEGLQVRAGYIWRVGRVLGPEQANGVFESDSFFVNAAVSVPIGQISVYHYDLDLDDRAGEPIQSRTTGLSYQGRTFFDGGGVFWEAAIAKQRSRGASPHYWRAATRANLGDFSLGVTLESLGSDEGVAFQTPLATLHRFQGAADLFLTTPEDGIDDIELRAQWRVGSLGPARATLLQVQYNRFEANRGGAVYGDEWGAEVATTLASTRASLAAAWYRAESFGEDTTRVWVTLARRF